MHCTLCSDYNDHDDNDDDADAYHHPNHHDCNNEPGKYQIALLQMFFVRGQLPGIVSSTWYYGINYLPSIMTSITW